MNARLGAGEIHTCALTSGGGVKCWGGNDSGQLGNGTETGSFVPVDVSGLANGIRALAAGGNLTCVLTSGGGVKCLGNGEGGRLGNGTTASSSVPVDVSGLDRGVTAIATSGDHTCAITNEGGIKCWGSNHAGELGDGTTTTSLVPVDVAGIAADVAIVSTGFGHTCALVSDGRVKCWGRNGSGELGNGTATDSSVPVEVSGLDRGITAIATSGDHTRAITNEGGVKCWGNGESGQLGHGTTTSSAVPVDVLGLDSGVTAIATNYSRSCAITTEGGVRCWGSNGTGELGDGTTTASLVPVDVSGLASGVSGIAVGGSHTCAYMRDGGAKCWGWNYFGQLGSLAACDRSSVPVEVAFATPSTGSEPIKTIDHATSPTDVLLRFDAVVHPREVDVTGKWFRPGPEFTLYGDGKVILRNELDDALTADGPIIRARPFRIGHLDEEQVQALLRYAIGEGALGEACERYHAQLDNDFPLIFTLHAGGLDRRVEVLGPSPMGPLEDHLRSFDRDGTISAQVWLPERYWGNLIELGSVREGDAVPWPWPDVDPEEFVVPAGYAFVTEGRRVMSADEAAVLGLSDNGGVVQRVYLRGPDGKTLYFFSLWPMMPDEENPS